MAIRVICGYSKKSPLINSSIRISNRLLSSCRNFKKMGFLYIKNLECLSILIFHISKKSLILININRKELIIKLFQILHFLSNTNNFLIMLLKHWKQRLRPLLDWLVFWKVKVIYLLNALLRQFLLELPFIIGNWNVLGLRVWRLVG